MTKYLIKIKITSKSPISQLAQKFPGVKIKWLSPLVHDKKYMVNIDHPRNESMGELNSYIENEKNISLIDMYCTDNKIKFLCETTEPVLDKFCDYDRNIHLSDYGIGKINKHGKVTETFCFITEDRTMFLDKILNDIKKEDNNVEWLAVEYNDYFEPEKVSMDVVNLFINATDSGYFNDKKGSIDKLKKLVAWTGSAKDLESEVNKAHRLISNRVMEKFFEPV